MKAVTAPNPIAGQSFSDRPEPHLVQDPPTEDQLENQAEDQVEAAVDDQERAGLVIREALRACPDLRAHSAARDALWLTVQDQICTTAPKMIQPFGSGRPFLVTDEYATEELITAMTWLTDHEAEARTFSPLHLFVRLRGVATRSSGGSARAAQADSLCGITEVPHGRSLRRGSADGVDAA